MFRKKGKAWAMNILLLILHSFFFSFSIFLSLVVHAYFFSNGNFLLFFHNYLMFFMKLQSSEKTLAVAKSNPLNSVFLIWYSTKHENEDSYGVHLYSLCWFSSEYQIFMISSLFPVTFLILISRMILGKHGIRPTALWRLS